MRRLKAALVLSVAGNAGLSWIATVLGYITLWCTRDGDSGLTVTLCKALLMLVSCLQAVLVVSYWNEKLRYCEIMRQALVPFGAQTAGLLKSPKAALHCLCECAFQLLTLPPKVNMTWEYTWFGKKSEISLDAVVYFAILLRNYHTLRLLYWKSRFASLRTEIIVKLTKITASNRFLLRCYIAAYTNKSIIGLMGVVVFGSAVIKYVIEHALNDPTFADQWDDLWVVAYTQLTIGYGERAPDTFLSQALVVVSCLVGIFMLGLFNAISSGTLVLSLTECNLYSELLYNKHKRGYSSTATILIQRWWRLMLMRKYKLLKAGTVMSFYSYQLLYRGTLVNCQRVKDTRFERQIEAFEKSTHKATHRLNEYLRPVSFAYTTVCPT